MRAKTAKRGVQKIRVVSKKPNRKVSRKERQPSDAVIHQNIITGEPFIDC